MRIPVNHVVKLTYYDLQNMKLILWGEEKIRLDAADFFGDLDIVDSLPFDTEIIVQPDQCVVICSFSPQLHVEKLQTKKIKFITINDMISTTDEIELYNNAVNHPTKKIIILGDAKDIIAQNPNIKIDYVLDNINDKLKNEHSEDIRIICTMEPNKTTRTELNNLGFVFGKDFYFHFYGKMRLGLAPPSNLLQKIMLDTPKYNMNCNINTDTFILRAFGGFLCCGGVNAFFCENLAYQGVEDMVHSVFFRIIQLGAANKTYSLCSDQCPRIGDKKYLTNDEKSVKRTKYRLLKPQEFRFGLGYDDSCNLKCRTCRPDYVTKPSYDEDSVEMVHKTVVENINLMPKFIFGNGEMLYGKYNRDILFNHNPYKEIEILTNGTLFNEENWRKLKEKYDRIKVVEVSVDTTNKEMYKYIRGANFDILMKNLRMLSELRKANKIECFMINFTITTANFREMKDFVLMSRELACDKCIFFKVREFDAFEKDKLYIEDVYDEKNPDHKEFLELVADPIFRSSDVIFRDKRGIEYIINAEEQL